MDIVIDGSLTSLLDHICINGLALIDPVLLDLLLDDIERVARAASSSGNRDRLSSSWRLESDGVDSFITRVSLLLQTNTRSLNKTNIVKPSDDTQCSLEDVQNVPMAAEMSSEHDSTQFVADCDDLACVLFRLLDCVASYAEWFNQLMRPTGESIGSELAQRVAFLCERVGGELRCSTVLARFLLQCRRHEPGRRWLRHSGVTASLLQRHLTAPSGRFRPEIDRRLVDALLEELLTEPAVEQHYDGDCSLTLQLLPFLVVLPRRWHVAVTCDPPWLMCGRIVQRAVRKLLCPRSSHAPVSPSVWRRLEPLRQPIGALCRRRPPLLAAACLAQLHVYLSHAPSCQDAGTVFREACCSVVTAELDCGETVRRVATLSLDAVLVCLSAAVALTDQWSHVTAVCLAPLCHLALTDTNDICRPDEQTRAFFDNLVQQATTYVADSDCEAIKALLNGALLAQNGRQVVDKMAAVFQARLETARLFGDRELGQDQALTVARRQFVTLAVRVWTCTLQLQQAVPQQTSPRRMTAVLSVVAGLLDSVAPPCRSSESLTEKDCCLTSTLTMLLTALTDALFGRDERVINCAVRGISATMRWLAALPAPDEMRLSNNHNACDVWTKLSGRLLQIMHEELWLGAGLLESISEALATVISAAGQQERLACTVNVQDVGRDLHPRPECHWLIEWLDECRLPAECLAALLSARDAAVASSARRYAEHLLAVVCGDFCDGWPTDCAASTEVFRRLWPSVCQLVRPTEILETGLPLVDTLELRLLYATLRADATRSTDVSVDKMDALIGLGAASDDPAVTSLAQRCGVLLVLNASKHAAQNDTSETVLSHNETVLSHMVTIWLQRGVARAVLSACENCSRGEQSSQPLQALRLLIASLANLPATTDTITDTTTDTITDTITDTTTDTTTDVITDKERTVIADTVLFQHTRHFLMQHAGCCGDIDNTSALYALEISSEELKRRAAVVLHRKQHEDTLMPTEKVESCDDERLLGEVVERVADIQRCVHMNTRLDVPTDCY